MQCDYIRNTSVSAIIEHQSNGICKIVKTELKENVYDIGVHLPTLV